MQSYYSATETLNSGLSVLTFPHLLASCGRAGLPWDCLKEQVHRLGFCICLPMGADFCAHYNKKTLCRTPDAKLLWCGEFAFLHNLEASGRCITGKEASQL